MVLYINECLWKLIIGLLLILISCKDNTIPISNIEEVNLIDAYNNRSNVPVSSVAYDLEYIRLETGKDFMTNDPHLINIKDSLILYIGFKKLYVFSANTGNFKFEISGFGRGPDEYTATSSIYYEEKDLFFISYATNRRDQNNFPIYGAHNYWGDLIKSVSIPILYNLENIDLPISRFWPLNDTLYIGYIDNPSINISEKLVVFTEKGKVISTYPNYNSIDIDESKFLRVSLHKGIFFNELDTVRFFELHTDTIFSVNSLIIKPRYYINMGDLLLPYQLRIANFSEYINYFHIRNMQESSRFLMFSVGIYGIRYLVAYDKILKKNNGL